MFCRAGTKPKPLLATHTLSHVVFNSSTHCKYVKCFSGERCGYYMSLTSWFLHRWAYVTEDTCTLTFALQTALIKLGCYCGFNKNMYGVFHQGAISQCKIVCAVWLRPWLETLVHRKWGKTICGAKGASREHSAKRIKIHHWELSLAIQFCMYSVATSCDF